MKKTILIGIIFLTMIAGAGCATQELEVKQVGVEQAQLKDQEIELYIEEDVNMGLYEPDKGVYLGAYVEKNIDLDNSIKQFEEVIGQKQAFRVFQYSKNARVQSSDVLKCIANRQVPYIKVMMDNEEDMSQIYRMVGDLKSDYKNPIFIELFPITSSMTNPEQYKKYYTEAYTIIKKYIKDAVIVWSSDLEKVEETMLYYPGNNLVDWVGLNIYLPQYKEGNVYSPAIMSSLDFWYKNFQEQKPMLISSLAVSYFSRYDHTYAIEDAKKKLSVFYEDIVQHYPRIKGIMYIDVDMKAVSNSGVDDYRVSAHSQIARHMTELQADGIFLHEVQRQNEATAKQYLKYTVPAVENKDKLYIPEEYARELFHHVKLKLIGTIEDLNGTRYYSLSQLLSYENAYYIK